MNCITVPNDVRIKNENVFLKTYLERLHNINEGPIPLEVFRYFSFQISCFVKKNPSFD